MHVTTKDTSTDGSKHTLTSVLEADGAHELASVDAALVGEVLSLNRTASGGIEVEVAITIHEPSAVPAPVEPEAKPELPEPVAEAKAEEGVLQHAVRLVRGSKAK